MTESNLQLQCGDNGGIPLSPALSTSYIANASERLANASETSEPRETVYEPDPEVQGPEVSEDFTRFDEIVLAIARVHPRAIEVVKDCKVANYMMTAILEAADVERREGEHAKNMRDAFAYLLQRTKLYKTYTDKWPRVTEAIHRESSEVL